jgi:hypothetical protein
MRADFADEQTSAAAGEWMMAKEEGFEPSVPNRSA